MHPRFSLTISCAVTALFFAGCQNTMFIGEQHGMNLSVEAKNDATEPAKFNFGFESHTAVVVPPKKPLDFRRLFNSREVPVGDSLSSVSRFRILHPPAPTQPRTNLLSGDTLTLKSVVATGDAANALFDSSPVVVPAPNGLRLRTFKAAKPVGTSSGIGNAAAAIFDEPGVQ